jgi:hypothetical protein
MQTESKVERLRTASFEEVWECGSMGVRGWKTESAGPMFAFHSHTPVLPHPHTPYSRLRAARYAPSAVSYGSAVLSFRKSILAAVQRDFNSWQNFR